MDFYTPDQFNELAKRIREANGIREDAFDIDITELARRLGYEVEEVDFSNDEVAGMYKREKNRDMIYVRKADPEERKRFSIAHELAHAILHDDGGMEYVDYRQPLKYYTRDEDFKKETQANMFAAALLMPKELVEKAWKSNDNIEALADLFHVSRRAATIRLDTLGLI